MHKVKLKVYSAQGGSALGGKVYKVIWNFECLSIIPQNHNKWNQSDKNTLNLAIFCLIYKYNTKQNKKNNIDKKI